MKSNIQPIILCGGEGRRLYPLSTPTMPKPFLPIVAAGVRSLLQHVVEQSWLRFKTEIWVCVGQKQLLQLQKDLAGLDVPVKIFVEPDARNTFPPCLMMAHYAASNSQLLFLPADHIVDYQSLFDLIEQSLDMRLYGIAPTSGEPSYGYIEHENFAIKGFTEKPTQKVAVSLRANGALWNSGIYQIPAALLLALAERQQPEHYCHSLSVTANSDVASHIYWSKNYSLFEPISIDHAIAQPYGCGTVAKFDGFWSDIGIWPRLLEYLLKDGEGYCYGSVLAQRCANSLLWCESGALECVGIDGCVIVRRGRDCWYCETMDAGEFKHISLENTQSTLRCVMQDGAIDISEDIKYLYEAG